VKAKEENIVILSSILPKNVHYNSVIILNSLRSCLFSCLALVVGLSFQTYANTKMAQTAYNLPIKLHLGVAGRSTVNNSFETGESVYLPVSIENISDRPIVVDTYFTSGLVNVSVKTPQGEILIIDPYERKQRHYEQVFGKSPLRIPPRETDFKRLAPRKSVSLSEISVLWESVSSPPDFSLAHEIISHPGEYTVEIVYRPKPSREFPNMQSWTGEVRSNSLKIRILNNDELACLEAQFPIQRKEALQIARSATISYFNDESRVKVHEPIRLRIQNKKEWYDISFVQDNGLTARWLRVLVDASSGKVSINPFGEGA
jgi:hypothetical protein